MRIHLATPSAREDRGVSATRPRQLLPREERQASILRAAATAFARTGFAATSMEDVAAEAGITKLIVYRHFESKEELYRSVLARIEDRLREELTELFARADRRGSTVRALLRVGREDPDGLRLLLVHARREPEFAAYADELRDRSIELAATLVGESIPDATIRRWATRTLVTYVFGAVLEWLDVGDATLDEEFVARATDGLMALYGTWSGSTIPDP